MLQGFSGSDWELVAGDEFCDAHLRNCKSRIAGRVSCTEIFQAQAADSTANQEVLPLPKFSKRIDDSDNGQGQRRLTFQPEPSVPRRAGTGSGAHPGNAAGGSGGIARESTNAVENIEDDDDAKVFKRLEAISKAAALVLRSLVTAEASRSLTSASLATKSFKSLQSLPARGAR